MNKRQRRWRQVRGVAPYLFWHQMIRFSPLYNTKVVITILLQGGEQATGIDRCCLSRLFNALQVRALGSLRVLS